MTTEQFIAHYNGLTMHERIGLINEHRDPLDQSDSTDICSNLGDFVLQLAEIHKYDPERLAKFLNEIDEGAAYWVYGWGNLYNIWDLADLAKVTGSTEDMADYYAELID